MKKHIFYFLLIFFITFSNSSRAVEVNEKIAFCRDLIEQKNYANNYEKQKAFNLCFNNAEALINKYEIEKNMKKDARQMSSSDYDKNEKMRKKYEVDRNRELKENPFKLFESK